MKIDLHPIGNYLKKDSGQYCATGIFFFLATIILEKLLDLPSHYLNWLWVFIGFTSDETSIYTDFLSSSLFFLFITNIAFLIIFLVNEKKPQYYRVLFFITQLLLLLFLSILFPKIAKSILLQNNEIKSIKTQGSSIATDYFSTEGSFQGTISFQKTQISLLSSEKTEEPSNDQIGRAHV